MAAEGPFHTPGPDDLIRMLRHRLDDAVQAAGKRKGEVTSSLAARNALRSGNAPLLIAQAAGDEFRQRLPDAMRLIAGFVASNALPIEVAIELSEPIFNEYIAKIGSSPNLPSAAIQADLMNKVHAELMNLRVGYVDGKYVKSQAPTIAKPAFELLKAIYDRASSDLNMQIDLQQVGRSAGIDPIRCASQAAIWKAWA